MSIFSRKNPPKMEARASDKVAARRRLPNGDIPIQNRDLSALQRSADCQSAVSRTGSPLGGDFVTGPEMEARQDVNEFDFRWNTRKMCEGARTVAAVQGAQGQQLDYRTLTK